MMVDEAELALQERIKALEKQVATLKEQNDAQEKSSGSRKSKQAKAQAQPPQVYLTEKEFKQRLEAITMGRKVASSRQAAEILNLLAGYKYNDWRNHYTMKSIQSHVTYGNIKPITPEEQRAEFGDVIGRRAFFHVHDVLKLPIAPWQFRGGDKPDEIRKYPKKVKAPVSQ